MTVLTALLVEDNPALRKGYVDALNLEDVKVYEADSKDQALRIYERRAQEISCVITDWRLKNHDEDDDGGLQVARAVRSITPSQAVFSVSAFVTQDDIRQNYDEFDDGFEKGAPDSEENFEDNIPRIIEIAKVKEKARQEEIPKQLIALKKKYSITEDDFRILIQNRQFTPAIERSLINFHNSTEIDFDDHPIHPDSQSLKILMPNSEIPGASNLKSPLLIVVSQTGKHYISELYGNPSVFAYAESAADATIQLLAILVDCHKEAEAFKNSDHCSIDLIRFQQYLHELFEGTE